MAVDFESMSPEQREQLRTTGYRVIDAVWPVDGPSYLRPKAKAVHERGKMNKLEERLYACLLTYTPNVWFEAVRFILAGNCTYEPDFMISTPSGVVFVESKGPFQREDSIIKLKVAAKSYPCFRWFLVKRNADHGWHSYPVTAERGISRKPIGSFEWIK